MPLLPEGWTLTRKSVRPSFDLGQLRLLFRLSDALSGPRLSEQDRRDAAYPYRLELPAPPGQREGRYRLVTLTTPGTADPGPLLEALEGREWALGPGRRRQPARLTTDLTEYERLLWEELASAGAPVLELERV